MKRSVVAGLALACLVCPLGSTVRAGEPDAVFKAVPADAWGMVALRNLAELDKKLTGLGQATNNPMAGVSALALAKGMLGLMSGLDDNGGVAFVLMPMESPAAFEQSVAILIPTTNYTELLGWMQPEDVGDGISKITFQQKESYAANKGGFAVVCPSIEAVKAVLQAKGSVTANMTKHQIERLTTDDLTVWVNAVAVTGSPMFEGVKATLEAVNIDTESITAMKSLQVSLRLGPEGIGLGWYLDAKPGTPMAKVWADVEPPTGSLLTGLPADAYVLAMGSVTGPGAGGLMADSMDRALASLPQTAGPWAQTVSDLGQTCKKLAAKLRSMAVGVNVPADGSHGLATATVLIGVDSGAADFLASVGELMAKVETSLPEEQAAVANGVLSYKAKAEGDGVDHLTIDPAGLGAGEEELGMVTQILGPEGLLFRLWAVDDQRLAITLGGGPAHCKTVTELVKGNQAPLDQEVGIKQTSGAMPANRTSEMFISPNGVAKLATAIAKVFGEEMPIKLPPVGTPIALWGFTTPGGGAQTDLLVPTELIKAVVEAFTSAVGGQPGGLDSPPM